MQVLLLIQHGGARLQDPGWCPSAGPAHCPCQTPSKAGLCESTAVQASIQPCCWRHPALMAAEELQMKADA